MNRFYLLGLIFLTSCNNSNDLLKSHSWSVLGNTTHTLTFKSDSLLEVTDSLGTRTSKWFLTENKLTLDTITYDILKLDKLSLFLRKDTSAIYFMDTDLKSSK
jgi:hypothetical protein